VNELDDELLDLLMEERICNHLHIPLQSGDDGVLKRMKRMYTSHYYIEKIERTREKIDGMALGTDIIVGFPGEGEKEFLNTRNLIEILPFSYLHIFPFSPRQGTDASGMGDQVDSAVKKRRLNELNALNYGKRIAYASSQIGKTLGIIVEDEDNNREVVGTSSNYLKVKTCADGYPKKSLIHVRIAEREGDHLRGVPIIEW
jgi:threonylcarbamoyladenosine tRNA methylthiotransferase MtaB